MECFRSFPASLALRRCKGPALCTSRRGASPGNFTLYSVRRCNAIEYWTLYTDAPSERTRTISRTQNLREELFHSPVHRTRRVRSRRARLGAALALVKQCVRKGSPAHLGWYVVFRLPVSFQACAKMRSAVNHARGARPARASVASLLSSRGHCPWQAVRGPVATSREIFYKP